MLGWRLVSNTLPKTVWQEKLFQDWLLSRFGRLLAVARRIWLQKGIYSSVIPRTALWLLWLLPGHCGPYILQARRRLFCKQKQSKHKLVFGAEPSLPLISLWESQQSLTSWSGNTHFSLATEFASGSLTGLKACVAEALIIETQSFVSLWLECPGYNVKVYKLPGFINLNNAQVQFGELQFCTTEQAYRLSRITSLLTLGFQ